MNTLKRSHIYILVFFFTLSICIAKQHIELDNTTKAPDINAQLNYSDKVEDYDDYNEVEILYPLEIRNYQNDNTSLEYKYKLKIEGISGAYKYKYKDKENYLVFTANGEAEIVLESNESIIIYDIPDNSSYEIEQTTDVSNKYVTKIDNKENNKTTGTVSSTSLVEFNNETLKEVVKPEVKPEQEETVKPEDNIEEDEDEIENPYTVDKHFLIILMTTLALMLVLTAKVLNIKRFG
jgi:hypothetical protein